MAVVLVATSTGLVGLDPGGGPAFRRLEGHDVRAVAPQGWSRLWAIVDAREIWRSAAGPDGWVRVASLDDLAGADADRLQATCLADTRANREDGILVGTSEARLLRIDGAGHLERVTGFDTVPGRDAWHTPWGGPPDTRTISESRTSVFVNVHVGGVARSRDGGAGWHPTIDIDADLHRVVTGHGRVYAAPCPTAASPPSPPGPATSTPRWTGAGPGPGWRRGWAACAAC